MFSYEHHVYGSTREKLIFILKECCLFLLCTKVVVAATRAHVGLFVFLRGGYLKELVNKPLPANLQDLRESFAFHFILC